MKNLKIILFFSLGFCLFTTTCCSGGQWLKRKCGDGICQRWELRRGSCPEDCKTDTPPVSSAQDALEIKMLTENGGHLAWNKKNNRIAFDRLGPDGYFDLWLMDPQGKNQECLTCDSPDLPDRLKLLSAGSGI